MSASVTACASWVSDAGMEPYFLSMDEVLAIHQDQIDRYGGEVALRDAGLLESAVMQPQASFADYLYSFPFGMAAAYLCGLIKNHAFIDGNKRTATAAAVVFLLMNGWELEMEEMDLCRLSIHAACGEIGQEQVATVLQVYARPLVD
ncbi:MAG: hypothetical protein RL095_1327 [Verrucomicrobiota bacterium]|jgi:death-on-curing protein